MNLSIRSVLATGVATVALLAVAGVASAASFTNVEFQNGQTTVEGNGGTSVTAKFRVVVPVNEVVEQIQTDVIGDGLAPVCTQVGGELGLEQGTHEVSMQVKLPPNTGTYNLDVQGSGIFGAFKADDCVGDVVGSASFGSALRTVSTSAGTGSTGGSGSLTAADITAIVKSILMSMGIGATPPTPPVATKCVALADHMLGAQYGVRNSSNVVLQGYLLSEHEQIPALAAGASFGLWLNETQAALTHFKSVNGCQ